MHGDAHGYEIRKKVGSYTGVGLNNNALYPALRRFEEAGAVTRSEQRQHGKPARQVYALTPVGREMLQDMLVELSPDQAGDDPEFLARVAEFAMLTPEERLRVIDAREAALRQRAHLLNDLRARVADEVWGGQVTSWVARRCDDEIAWLEPLRALARTQPVLPEGE